MRSLLLPLALLFSMNACSLFRDPPARALYGPIERQEVQALLDRQAANWNRGDLAAFVSGYSAEEELTFFGSRGLVRGREALLKSYESGYPDAASRGTLRFDLVEFRPLGGTHALVVGQFALEREEPASGWFSLVITRDNDGAVRIVHDHTS